LAKTKIAISGLKKSYIERRANPRDNNKKSQNQGHEIVIFENLDLVINEGEFVALLGPSGCGKSTLLRMIAGFIPPTAGSILINNKKVHKPSPDYIFVYQEGGLFPWLTARQNIGMGIRSINEKEKSEELVSEYIDMVELTGKEDYYPHELSGGMRQRAELARALVTQPEILFLDEPFSGLDHLTRLKMREELLNMHMFIRKTMILVTHDIDEALQLADHLIVLGEIPACVKYSIHIDEHHPRNLDKGTLADIRKDVYRHLGVHLTL
jgi:ABC-type nitrate/sulfonate/bicarbonate transport system ATPase subunit